MADLHVTDIEGIRCVWVDSGRPTLAARLVFRYGLCDEPILESGWQHLLEHLILDGLGGGALHVNGSVSLLHTSFDAHGPSELVSAHLTELARRIAAPPGDRVEHEAKVLHAEALMRAGHPSADALAYRYGAAGPGLLAWHGPATGRATAAALTNRAHRVMTRENAVLVLDGPPPVGLRMMLPEGEQLLPPPAVAVADVPAAYVDDRGPIVSGVVSRSAAMAMGHDLLRQAFEREFRTKAGAAYAPWSSYEPVDADNAIILGGSDLGTELMSVVVNRTLTLIRALRTLPVSQTQIEELVAARVQVLEDPYAVMGLALAGATELLAGREPLPLDHRVEQTRAVTGTEIQQGFRELSDTLLFGVPGQATWLNELPMQQPNNHPVSGRVHRSVNWPADSTRVRISGRSLAFSDRNDFHTIKLDSVAALLAYPDGVRQVVQRDGSTATLDPRAWHGGARVVAKLDRSVDAILHLPQPPVERPAYPRLSFARRWSWPLTHRNHFSSGYLLFLAAVALVALMGYGASKGLVTPGVVSVTAGLCIAGLIAWTRDS